MYTWRVQDTWLTVFWDSWPVIVRDSWLVILLSAELLGDFSFTQGQVNVGLTVDALLIEGKFSI